MIYGYEHVKRKTRYTVVSYLASVQSSIPIQEGDEVVVYRDDESGKTYVRPISEFYDGRFRRYEKFDFVEAGLAMFLIAGTILLLLGI